METLIASLDGAAPNSFLSFLMELNSKRAAESKTKLWRIDSSKPEQKIYSCGSFAITEKLSATAGARVSFDIVYQENSTDTPEQKIAQQQAFGQLFAQLTSPVITIDYQIRTQKDLEQFKAFIQITHNATPPGTILQWDLSKINQATIPQDVKADYDAALKILPQKSASVTASPHPAKLADASTAKLQKTQSNSAINRQSAADLSMRLTEAGLRKASAYMLPEGFSEVIHDTKTLLNEINKLASGSLPPSDQKVQRLTERSQRLKMQLTQAVSDAQLTASPEMLYVVLNELYTLIKIPGIISHQRPDIDTSWVANTFDAVFDKMLPGQLAKIREMLALIKVSEQSEALAKIQENLNFLNNMLEELDSENIPQDLKSFSQQVDALYAEFLQIKGTAKELSIPDQISTLTQGTALNDVKQSLGDAVLLTSSNSKAFFSTLVLPALQQINWRLHEKLSEKDRSHLDELIAILNLIKKIELQMTRSFETPAIPSLHEESVLFNQYMMTCIGHENTESLKSNLHELLVNIDKKAGPLPDQEPLSAAYAAAAASDLSLPRIDSLSLLSAEKPTPTTARKAPYDLPGNRATIIRDIKSLLAEIENLASTPSAITVPDPKIKALNVRSQELSRQLSSALSAPAAGGIDEKYNVLHELAILYKASNPDLYPKFVDTVWINRAFSDSFENIFEASYQGRLSKYQEMDNFIKIHSTWEHSESFSKSLQSLKSENLEELIASRPDQVPEILKKLSQNIDALYSRFQEHKTPSHRKKGVANVEHASEPVSFANTSISAARKSSLKSGGLGAY